MKGICGIRDWEYIEARLISPMNNALEARGRLLQVGYDAEAQKLREAMQVFQDACRDIRYEIQGERARMGVR